ncbi:Tetratricopeptide-like helical [Fusarium austroafricanum]|uniref:Tetratricopeptide-like helical n=1 Tax=Fusarium austroafricanum TaxID=2364996 RepID=A0A8H4K8R4_9HYPO|nr:Tetratricopeptide-like helical [Fusarium austroafricanum]
MEIVGVIAAVPGLIELIEAATTAVRGLSKRKVAAKLAEDLVLQLHDLEGILQDIEKRCKHGGSGQLRLQRVSTSFTQLKVELVSLQKVLQATNLKKEPTRYLKKILLISTSLDKTLNESLTRLTQIKTSLTLHITHDLLDSSFSARRLGLRDLLRPSGDSFIPNKTPKTCDWVWSHPMFLDWVHHSSVAPDANLNRILCVYGTKGCGKSVLVKSIAEEFRGRGEVILHFSFWAGSEAQRKLYDLLRTVTWQILTQITDSDLEKLSKPLIQSPSITQHDLIQALGSCLSLISQKVYLAIDGIDESVDDWNSHTDGPLSTILDLVTTHENLHVLMAGREPSMRTILKKTCPRLEITNHLIRDDMHKLIASELNGSLSSHPPPIRDMIKDSLEAKSEVMFLWVKLVLNELRRCFCLEEIRQTLTQVPHDLDREYHRLFSQLMIRTSGTNSRPSVSMRRAKYLLSALLACPEPMTARDLCYAYASQVNSSGPIENDLITVDGITDACGDFLSVTQGCYHLVHASVYDFLTRSQEEWEHEDLAISYFRVDIAESHESMSSACFKYLGPLDLGYPLTDNGASSLPSRYPFFVYVAKFVPFHIIQAIAGSGRELKGASQFMSSRQFCALIEYTLLSLQNPMQDFDSPHYWMEMFGLMIGFGNLEQTFNIELQRRLTSFGEQDERYQTWLSLGSLLPSYTEKSFELLPEPVAMITHNRRPGRQMNGNAFASLPQYLGQTHGPVVQRLSQKFGAVSQVFQGLRRAATNLLASSVESLPIPMVLFAAVVARGQKNWLLAERLAAISTRRTRGNSNILEVCSLLLLASTKTFNDMYNSEDCEMMVQEAIRITNQLPGKPYVELYKLQAYSLLLRFLMEQGKTDEVDKSIHALNSLVGLGRETSNSPTWEYFFCHTRAGQLTTQAVAILQELKPELDKTMLRMLHTHRETLFSVQELDQCLSDCQHLLRLSEGQKSGSVEIFRWKTMVTWARCLIEKGDVGEAKEVFRKAADEYEGMSLNEKQQIDPSWLLILVQSLALFGLYSRSQSTARTALEIKEIEYKEDVLLGPLQSLFFRLQTSGSIDGDSEECLRCFSLPIALDEEVNWWKKWSFSLSSAVPCCRKAAVLQSLKYIDTCLRLDTGVPKAIAEYESLVRFFVRQGDMKAAELVASDAASRTVIEVSLIST